MSMYVITHNNVEGLHFWKDAPEHLDYLRNKHRHIFCIECGIEVKHNDRQYEIIETQKQIEKSLKQFYSEKYDMLDFENMSCEMISYFILDKFNDMVYCRVTEDGFGGAECHV